LNVFRKNKQIGFRVWCGRLRNHYYHDINLPK
jgi:hypothetical protein